MPTRDQPWPQGTPCWVDLVADDADNARAFYAELFGWEVVDGPPEAGGYLMATKNGRPAAGIAAKMEGQEDLPSTWTTYLAADSADTVADAVIAAGGVAHMAPFDVMDVGRMFVASDPSGAVFGVWEARAHLGAGIFNEAGAYCWNELHTRDYAGAQAFYQAVFGYRFDELGDGMTFTYATFTAPGEDQPCGGINDDTHMPVERPAHWLTWFQVEDCDGATATATGLGGRLLMGPDDSPFGRTTVVAGPQGEVFGLIDPGAAVVAGS